MAKGWQQKGTMGKNPIGIPLLLGGFHGNDLSPDNRRAAKGSAGTRDRQFMILGSLLPR